MIDLKYFADYGYYKILFNLSYVEYLVFERYEKSLFSNRCVIPGANGPIVLSVPLHGGRNQKTIFKDVRIDNGVNWQKRHYRSLLSTYNASPWFKYYSDSLSYIYEKQFSFLLDWNLVCLAWSIEKLKLPVVIKVIDAGQPGQEDVILKQQKPMEEQGNAPRYHQLFEEKTGFIPGVSILDMLFCEGQGRVLASLAAENA